MQSGDQGLFDGIEVGEDSVGERLSRSTSHRCSAGFSSGLYGGRYSSRMLDSGRLVSLERLEEFLAATAGLSPRVAGGEPERQAHVCRVLGRFGYARLSRRHKGVVVRYLQHTSGYSRQHLVRLIGRFVSHAPLGQRRAPQAGFPWATRKRMCC